MILLLFACDPEPGWQPEHLVPYDNPLTEDDPLWAAQPHRSKPQEIVTDGTRAWVSLPGTPDEPGHRVAVADLESGELAWIDTQGSGPWGLALSPDHKWLVVCNRFSNFLTLVDAETNTVEGFLPADFYSTEAGFSPEGDELWITNRWTDAVAVWDLDLSDGFAVVEKHEPGLPVAPNPRDVVVTADRVAVASVTGLGVTLIRRSDRSVIADIDLGAPANGLAALDDTLVVATTSASTHHQPFDGPDGDDDGQPGDGTPNINFQDLQNELALFRLGDGAELVRYTSDSICCRDFRDVDPDDDERLGGYLPPEETWIVGGALPEQVVVDGDTVWVDYAASNEVQSFTLADGTLTPGPVWETEGHHPQGLAVAGDRVLVVHRLSETLGLYSRDGELLDLLLVGDARSTFPATDAEIGELFNFVTAPFTVDGDQSCGHCHREGGNVDKAFSMPLSAYPGLGSRMTMAYRGAFDTRPWFFESAFDQDNFRPVMNEFARIENYCCSDYSLWPDGAPSDCAANPPPECSEPNASSDDGVDPEARPGRYPHDRPTPYVSRDEHFRAVAADLTGREKSFGDSVFWEDPVTGSNNPLSLGFDGITKALGAFLLARPNLLPNPNDPDTDMVRLGQQVFERADVGCSSCHPAPTFSINDGDDTTVPVRLGPVVTPFRADDGTNLDLLAEGFVQTFPLSEQDSCEEVCGEELCAEDPTACDDLRDVSFGVPSLRGLWDRAPSMLHDGRAQDLWEVVCTPGHPALRDRSTLSDGYDTTVVSQGFNERDGVPDTHGGTSHLSVQEVDALVAYLLTL